MTSESNLESQNQNSEAVRSGKYGGWGMAGLWFLLNTAPL
jgi:hypothetical protein